MARADLVVRRDLVIPADELSETASRAGGPGGQHVNKTSTRVTLRWSIEASRALGERQRARLRERLGRRLTRGGELVVHAGRCRSRARNRERARETLADLVRDALAQPRKRVATRPSRGARRQRLDAKRRHSTTKQRRGRVRSEEA